MTLAATDTMKNEAQILCGVVALPWMQEVLVRHAPSSGPRQLFSPQSAVDVARKLLADSPVERILALLLATNHTLVGAVWLGTGTATMTLADPRVLVRAIAHCNATAMILAHNHPSGKVTPSAEDLGLTSKIRDIGAILDCGLLDHIIVGGAGEFFSFRRENLTSHLGDAAHMPALIEEDR